jgi:hypothetical protein
LRLRAFPRGVCLRYGLLGLRDLFSAWARFHLCQLRLCHSQRVSARPPPISYRCRRARHRRPSGVTGTLNPRRPARAETQVSTVGRPSGSRTRRQRLRHDGVGAAGPSIRGINGNDKENVVTGDFSFASHMLCAASQIVDEPAFLDASQPTKGRARADMPRCAWRCS